MIAANLDASCSAAASAARWCSSAARASSWHFTSASAARRHVSLAKASLRRCTLARSSSADAAAVLQQRLSAVACANAFPRAVAVSLICNGLCPHSSRLSTLLLRLQRTHAENLLVLHVGKCGLTLQSPQGLASKPGEEALAAEPQEDDSSGRCVPCLSGASAKSPPLLKEVLATCSLPLTFGGGALVKKMLSCVSGLLAGSLLLASTSGVLVKDPLAEECLVLVHPQIVWPTFNPCMRGPHERKPHEEWAPHIPAAAIRQPLGLRGWLVDANLRCEAVDQRRPGGGVVTFILVEQPLGGACGRLRPFELQPPGRIGEGGRGRMSRRGSTVPHLGRIRGGIVCRFDHFV